MLRFSKKHITDRQKEQVPLVMLVLKTSIVLLYVVFIAISFFIFPSFGESPSPYAARNKTNALTLHNEEMLLS